MNVNAVYNCLKIPQKQTKASAIHVFTLYSMLYVINKKTPSFHTLYGSKR